MDNLPVPNVSEYKYIGIIIRQTNCDQDIKIKKFYPNFNMLLTRFRKCSTPVKCYVFKTYCFNV